MRGGKYQGEDIRECNSPGEDIEIGSGSTHDLNLSASHPKCFVES